MYGVCYSLSEAFGRLVYGGGLLGAGELDNLGLLLAIPLVQAACRRGHGVYCRCLGNHQYYGSILSSENGKENGNYYNIGVIGIIGYELGPE